MIPGAMSLVLTDTMKAMAIASAHSKICQEKYAGAPRCGTVLPAAPPALCGWDDGREGWAPEGSDGADPPASPSLRLLAEWVLLSNGFIR